MASVHYVEILNFDVKKIRIFIKHRSFFIAETCNEFVVDKNTTVTSHDEYISWRQKCIRILDVKLHYNVLPAA